MPSIRPLNNGVARLGSYVRRLQKCCERVEEQLTGNRLLVSDVELVYTSGFLSLVTKWEAFLEDSLYETVCGSVPPRLERHRYTASHSRAQLRNILLHPDKEFIQITTVKQAKGLFELFLRNGRPFAAISETNKTYIQQAIWIRNAIAHSGDAALGNFRDKVPGVSSLPSNRRQPGPFLRHMFRVSPDQRRFELYCAAFVSAATEMGGAWTART